MDFFARPIIDALVNFEDDRFAEFKTPDFQTLYESYLEVESPSGRKYFFLDEIQNLPGWHRWLNRLYEFEDVKLFITGSNSSMMKGEAAMSLTGRNRLITLYPFSFREYAAACNVTWTERDLLTGEGKAKLSRLFGRYTQEGGFLEVVRQQEPDILRHYFGDIVYRDIVARYGLRNVREIRELALYLASNLSCLASYKKLKDTITVNSLTTVKNYLGYFEDVYLFFPVNLFDYSLKRQMYNPAKSYCVDHALTAAMAFKFSADTGRGYWKTSFSASSKCAVARSITGRTKRQGSGFSDPAGAGHHGRPTGLSGYRHQQDPKAGDFRRPGGSSRIRPVRSEDPDHGPG